MQIKYVPLVNQSKNVNPNDYGHAYQNKIKSGFNNP